MAEKRILPWKEYANKLIGEWQAKTKIGWYKTHRGVCGIRWDLLAGQGYACPGGYADTYDLAMDAAEADYLDRVTEFVPVLKPGQVGISREDAETITEYFSWSTDIPTHMFQALERVTAVIETSRIADKTYRETQPDAKGDR